MRQDENAPDAASIDEVLKQLKLPFIRENHHSLAETAARQGWSHRDYLAALARGEADRRLDHAVRRRVTSARFPVVKTLDGFNWTWPAAINELQIKHLFHLDFVRKKTNVIFLGGVGLGKTHLATSLAHNACLRGHSVLFSTAIDAINALSAAQAAGSLRPELKKYVKPDLLVLDELGYLPIDKTGADLLFQIISERYERGAIVLTTNRAFKDWGALFHNDATVASAVLDRLLHNSDVVVIEGKSYRMRERIEN